jgi:O-antigen biosynthesis protein
MASDQTQRAWWQERLSSFLIPVPIGRDLLPLYSFAELVNLWIPKDDSVCVYSEEDALSLIRDMNIFFFIAPADAILSSDLAAIVEQYILRRPDAQIFYADDAVFDPNGHLESVHCKPQLDRALLLAKDYIGFPLLIRPAVLSDRGRFQQIASSDFWYDLCVGASSSQVIFERIPHTLIGAVGQRAEASVLDRRAVIERRFQNCRISLDAASGAIKVQRKFLSYPDVTIIVPTKRSRMPTRADGSGGAPYIISLLESLGKTTWPLEKIRVLIGDDCGNDGFYAQREWPYSIRVVSTKRDLDQRFNYAHKLNRLWRLVETELFIILNDDITIDNADWLEALYTFALDESVGGVGARLLFPDRSIQHAGMLGGIYDVFAHPWYNTAVDTPTYEGWSNVHRDQSAVTGAAFATRRSVMEAVNGFDEKFSLDFNDVDLCLRIKLLGYRIVYTPHAQMFHHESASRKNTFASGEEIALFLNRWRDCIQDDPMFSPQLDHTTDKVRPLPSATAKLESAVNRAGLPSTQKSRNMRSSIGRS